MLIFPLIPTKQANTNIVLAYIILLLTNNVFLNTLLVRPVFVNYFQLVNKSSKKFQYQDFTM